MLNFTAAKTDLKPVEKGGLSPDQTVTALFGLVVDSLPLKTYPKQSARCPHQGYIRALGGGGQGIESPSDCPDNVSWIPFHVQFCMVKLLLSKW